MDDGRGSRAPQCSRCRQPVGPKRRPQIAPTPEAALEAGIEFARKIAACAPLSIKATLNSAHQYVDPVEADALSKLGAQYAALYRTEDFIEGRRAEAEGRPPRYVGR